MNSESSRKFILYCLCIGNLLLFTTYIIPASFYPKIALSRGIKSGLTGIILSFYSIGALISSAIAGKYLNSWRKSRFFLVFGVICFISTFMFGCLEWIHDKWFFFAFSIFCRFLQGVSTAGMLVVSFSYITELFPNEVQQNGSLLEGFAGMGTTGGVLFGTILYTLTSFKNVFFIFSTVIVVVTLFITYFLNNYENQNPKIVSNDMFNEENEITYFSVLKNPRYFFSFCIDYSSSFSIAACIGVMGFHLLEIGQSQNHINIIFLIASGSYFLFNILLSAITFSFDRRILVLVGILLGYFGVLSGPWTILGLPNSLYIISAGFVICNLGSALGYVPIYPELIDITKYIYRDSGIKNLDDKANAINSAMTVFAMNLGEFVGPLVSGFMNEHYGYDSLMVMTIVIQTFNFFIYLIFAKAYEVFQGVNPVQENLKYHKFDQEVELPEQKLSKE